MKGGRFMHTTRLDAKAYRTRERRLRHSRGELVLGGKIRPRWIEDGARFWYTVNTPEGKRFIVADTRTGSRDVAFDHEKLATALTAASGYEADARALPI